jgi:hypothetical protein
MRRAGWVCGVVVASAVSMVQTATAQDTAGLIGQVYIVEPQAGAEQ